MNVKEAARQLDIRLTGYRGEELSYAVLDKLANPDPVDENLYRLIVCFKSTGRIKRSIIYHLRWNDETWSFDQSMTNKKLEKKVYQKSPWEQIDVE